MASCSRGKKAAGVTAQLMTGGSDAAISRKVFARGLRLSRAHPRDFSRFTGSASALVACTSRERSYLPAGHHGLDISRLG
jgi:hypothetical protein